MPSFLCDFAPLREIFLWLWLCRAKTLREILLWLRLCRAKSLREIFSVFYSRCPSLSFLVSRYFSLWGFAVTRIGIWSTMFRP